MARLDDDELNINPEVAAALGYPRRGTRGGAATHEPARNYGTYLASRQKKKRPGCLFS